MTLGYWFDPCCRFGLETSYLSLGTTVDRFRVILASAADLVLTASGTATLEAMLLQRPMLVGYRLSAPTYGLIRALDLVKVPHVSLPNLLAGEALVPEFIQERCRAEVLGPALLDLLDELGIADNTIVLFCADHGDYAGDQG